MKKLFIAMLSYTGQIEIETQNALVGTIGEANGKGWAVHYVAHVGDSAVPRGRNAMVADFMASDCTDLIFIDADVSWQPGALIRLASPDVDLVLGCYPSRSNQLRYTVRYLDRPMLIADPETGLLEIEGGPGGFMRISRRCAEQMIEGYAHLWHWDELVPGCKVHALFDFQLDQETHQYFTEDFVFCRRFRALGGKVWLDPMLEFGHTGRHTWRGCIGQWLLSRPPEEMFPPAAALQAAE